MLTENTNRLYYCILIEPILLPNKINAFRLNCSKHLKNINLQRWYKPKIKAIS